MNKKQFFIMSFTFMVTSILAGLGAAYLNDFYGDKYSSVIAFFVAKACIGGCISLMAFMHAEEIS